MVVNPTLKRYTANPAWLRSELEKGVSVARRWFVLKRKMKDMMLMRPLA